MASGREGSSSALPARQMTAAALWGEKSCGGGHQNNNKRPPGARGMGQLGCSRCQAEISPGAAEDKEVGRDNATFPARCPPAAGLNIAGLLLGRGSLAAVPQAALAGSTEHLPRGCGVWRAGAGEGSQPPAGLRAGNAEFRLRESGKPPAAGRGDGAGSMGMARIREDDDIPGKAGRVSHSRCLGSVAEGGCKVHQPGGKGAGELHGGKVPSVQLSQTLPSRLVHPLWGCLVWECLKARSSSCFSCLLGGTGIPRLSGSPGGSRHRLRTDPGGGVGCLPAARTACGPCGSTTPPPWASRWLFQFPSPPPSTLQLQRRATQSLALKR